MVVKDNPSLGAVGGSQNVKKIVVDSKLRITLSAKLFQNTKKEDCIIVTTKQSSASKRTLKVSVPDMCSKRFQR